MKNRLKTDFLANHQNIQTGKIELALKNKGKKSLDSLNIFDEGKQWIAPYCSYLQVETSPTQTRIKLDRATINRYGKLMFDGHWNWTTEEEPIVLFWDSKKEKLYCGDGHHRIQAALEQQLHRIYVEIRYGNLVDAKIYNCISNNSHGKQTTKKDKQNQIEILLKSRSQLPENDYRNKWSFRQIASFIGVDHKTVSKISMQLHDPHRWQEQVKKEKERKKQKIFYNFRKLLEESNHQELKEYLEKINPKELSKLKSILANDT